MVSFFYFFSCFLFFSFFFLKRTVTLDKTMAEDRVADAAGVLYVSAEIEGCCERAVGGHDRLERRRSWFPVVI